MMYLIINNKMNIIYNTIIYRQWVEIYMCVYTCLPVCLSVSVYLCEQRNVCNDRRYTYICTMANNNNKSKKKKDPWISALYDPVAMSVIVLP